MILLDTNLLTRMTRSREPQAGVARAAVQTLLRRGELLVPYWFHEFPRWDGSNPIFDHLGWTAYCE